MILTQPQVRELTKCQGICNDILPVIEWLERVAAVYPLIQDRVKELRDEREMLAAVSHTALEADRVLSQAM